MPGISVICEKKDPDPRNFVIIIRDVGFSDELAEQRLLFS